MKTSAGKQLLSTASPVIDGSGNVHLVVCNLRNVSTNPDGKTHKNRFQSGKYLKYNSNNLSIDNGKYELVYTSKKMQVVVEMSYQLSGVDSTVLILGETGVGKELIARLIHSSSVRANSGSLIKVNCAAIPNSLIESELFGYEPGSFTDL